MPTRIGIDTGGTFTDIVRLESRGLRVHKVPSTPDDPGRAVLQGLAAVRARPDEAVDLVHGTTVGLNAVLQGRLPRTAFVTNTGFRDLIEIGRQQREDLYALEPHRAVPPVPRELRIEVDCRRDQHGRVVRALTRQAIEQAIATLRSKRPVAVAIGLLHSPTAAADEQRLARAIRRALPDVAVTCSAELLPAFGEYERFCAAILNAAITPLVSNYTRGIVSGLGPGRLRLLRSSLGTVSAEETERFAARTMFSGPAGGVLATQQLGAAAGLRQLAAFDMGGTSTDVCLVQEEHQTTDEGEIAGLPLPLPTVPVHTVGCGGGSIAWRDSGGALRVGPHSAGAVPGPACYGHGTEPTVTDAHVALGHIGGDTLLGGDFPIDPDRSVKAIERLARQLGLSSRRTAEGILEVADIAMARALMRITVEQAIDAAEVPLVAYGGAGGLHAASLCAQLSMPLAITPAHAGAFSALGLALAGESHEIVEARREPLTPLSQRQLQRDAKALCREAAKGLGADGLGANGSGANGLGEGTRTKVRTQAIATLRYLGQGAGLRLAVEQISPAAFAAAHQRRFGFVPDVPIEIVQLIARADTPARPFPRVPGSDRATGTRRRNAKLVSADRKVPLGAQKSKVFRRSDLPVGSVIEGPCFIEEVTSVTRVPTGWSAEMRALGVWLVAVTI